MNPDLKLSDTDNEYERKVFVIADEVLNILRELSTGSRHHISSKAIADRMYWKDSVTSILTGSGSNELINDAETECMKKLSGIILNDFSDVVPSCVNKQINDLYTKLYGGEISGGVREQQDSPINIIKKYVNSIAARNSELEEFMRLTMEYLIKTEAHLEGELNAHHEKFTCDREFETKLSTDMNDINQSFEISDLDSVRAAVFSKIDLINRGIVLKREQDLKRLRTAEKTIEEMSYKMTDIKREAEEIRRIAGEIEFESIRDNLTGLYNRKAYNEKVAETLANLRRYNVSSCLMLCDVDNFKAVNDTFGHNVGDLALKKLAALFKKRLRNSDFISRYGGEEFVFILPHTDLHSAIRAGEGIRSYIDKSVFHFKGQRVPLKISIGISSFRKESDDDAVFEKADKALFLAKKSGKNQVKSENDIDADNP